ncbi:class II fructose-1,6-bisphosphate aldolase [Mahella sp.]|uniref:class II fructose-1,6-bisphosphate aldolase n=1 Tax=Mahella sp. TaxID=2798721 RepID=UPI0025C6362D|nr:class II fructose-1,6-bisphosphate aldolase [Mahella sp.]MBZ4666520.1 fructose-bisphosphate aldolase [Mahella sp.]
MSLVTGKKILDRALSGHYAIGAFNVHNMETVQAVVNVAIEEKAPLIIQTSASTIKYAGAKFLAANVKAAAEDADIPIALHLDHATTYQQVVECIRVGYTSVMIDGSKLPYDENVALTKKVVELAHYAGVSVEAELGKVGGTEDDISVDEREAAFTVPEEAVKFIEDTDVDYLAIAIGTAHGVYKGEPKLDFERLKKIRSMVNVPLVLHGASGVPDEGLRNAVVCGINKINLATDLKIPMARTIRDIFMANPDEDDPRKYLGAARDAVEVVVRDKIRVIGCNGKAIV